MLWRSKSNPNLAKDPVAMRYRVTKEQLEKITKKPTKNQALNQMAAERFRAYGKDGMEQFIKDFVNRDYKLMGFNQLGLSQDCIQTLKNEHLLVEQINIILQHHFGIDNYHLIINAHSQNATDCIVNLLNEASFRMGEILISQPTQTRSINLFKDADGIIYLEFYSDNIPITVIDTNKKSNIPGPMKALLQLIPDVNKPYYELVYLETDNEHIYKMCIGEDVTAQELIETYFSPTTQRLITQHNTLTERYKHIDEANISLQAQLKVSQESNTTLANALKEFQSEQMQLKIAQDNITELKGQLQASQEINTTLAKQLEETQQRIEQLTAENTAVENKLKQANARDPLNIKIESTLDIFKWYKAELLKDIPKKFHADIKGIAQEIIDGKCADLSASVKKAIRKCHSINVLTAILNDKETTPLQRCQQLKDEYELHGHQKILEMSREHPVVKAIKGLLSVLTAGTGFLFFFKTKGHTATRAVKALFQQESKEKAEEKAPGAGQ